MQDMNNVEWADWSDEKEQGMSQRFFVRMVWSGEPQENPDDKLIVKETIGTFVEDGLSALDAINAVGSKLIEAGAFVTHMHYIAAMECDDPAIEKQVREAEQNLVLEFNPEYIAGCVARSEAREVYIAKAAEQRAAALKRK